jgi:hypothetical protein
VETAIEATSEIVREYGRLFVNRGAYTLQSSRPHPESGRHYYFRPKPKETGGELCLTAATIRRHLEGELTIGLYAINPSTQRSKWVAIDADYAGAMEDLLKLQYFLFGSCARISCTVSLRARPCDRSLTENASRATRPLPSLKLPV